MMDIIYEFLFLGLIDTTQRSKVPRPIRIFAAVLVGLIFIIAILSLGTYAVVAVDQGIFKRLMSAVLSFALAGFYHHLLKAMIKEKRNI